MSGTFVAVVGPSGVGKDSLIGFARDRLEASGGIHVVRRVVTRLADGGSEDHDSMDEASFAQAERDGAFALTWEAHGLRYGLPLALEDDLRAGKVVIANLSRAMIPALVARYPDAVVVAVSAEREVIEQRLAGRGRETAESIQRRIERRVTDRLPASTVRIDNSGALEVAGMQFVQLLEDVAGVARSDDRKNPHLASP
ncbi:MAG: phosphonate metabolism protein/1,5-bisphosphokinase (PRPP-forming) PhnN [Devosia sp.]